ncbi:MAG: hypothetical protein IH969_06215 [Candidatus Krumholzibacteriota bacterium]|nr:hypothetical protein [Candidatus Krumholzibacteriota bacterium]
MKRSSITIVLAGLIAVVLAQDATSSVLVEFDRARSNDLSYAGFHLDGERELEIRDTGYAYRSSGTRFSMSDAWILDSKTREVVWDMYEEREEWKSKRIVSASYTVKLPAGDYEVYYSTYPNYRTRKWYDDKSGYFGGIFGRGSRGALERLIENENVDDEEDLYRRFSFRVEGTGTSVGASDVDNMIEKGASDAIISLRRVRDHEFIEKGFELTRAMKIHIYAVGESNKNGVYDYGWVMNVETREKVWRFSYAGSDAAGGAKKNRTVNDVFEAPAGRYVLAYTTDDSHSWERWNAAPPHDPSFWGVTLRAEKAANTQYVKLFDYEEETWKNVVVDLTQVGDDELVKAGFSLKREMDLRVYAIGEGTGGDMYDYGWIIDARTRKRVWTMDYDDTDHAGGAKKNRVFDDVVHFEKGDYIAYYATDGSHSYPHWNSTAPPDRRHWGLTIAGANGFNAKDVAKFKGESELGDALVLLTEIGDDEYVSKSFVLKKRTSVNIYALGEGVDGRMYDYGWIEEKKTGRVVWEMTFRKTEHAGGARKNRMYSDTITFEPGEYTVFYETDGSHSYHNWNASRPYEPESWGISLRTVSSS